jgi:hypothetical protein
MKNGFEEEPEKENEKELGENEEEPLLKSEEGTHED